MGGGGETTGRGGEEEATLQFDVISPPVEALPCAHAHNNKEGSPTDAGRQGREALGAERR